MRTTHTAVRTGIGTGIGAHAHHAARPAAIICRTTSTARARTKFRRIEMKDGATALTLTTGSFHQAATPDEMTGTAMQTTGIQGTMAQIDVGTQIAG